MAEYKVERVENLMGGAGAPPEYDVWRVNGDDEPQRLIASYAFAHQAREVAEVLNKWKTAEI
jgi:hypothetical protein